MTSGPANADPARPNPIDTCRPVDTIVQSPGGDSICRDPLPANPGGPGPGTGGGPGPANDPADPAPPACTPRPPTIIPPDLVTADLPRTTISTSPTSRSITGIETHLWLTDLTTTVILTPTWTPGITADCQPIAPPPDALDDASTTVTLTAVTWHPDHHDPAVAIPADHAGTRDDPSAHHTYETTGTRTITATCTWTTAANTSHSATCATLDHPVAQIRTTRE